MAFTRLPEEQILEAWNALDEKAQQYFAWFAQDVSAAILKNFSRMEISPHGHLFTGDLERSIHWTIYTKARGSKALIAFYYLYYGRFVELAVQRAMKYVPLPPIKEPHFEPIPRPDGKPRKAKPAINSEIRRGVKRMMTRLVNQYAFVGGAWFAFGFTPDGSRQSDVIQFRTEGYKVGNEGDMV